MSLEHAGAAPQLWPLSAAEPAPTGPGGDDGPESRPVPAVRVLVAAAGPLRMQMFVHYFATRRRDRCVASTPDLGDLVSTCRVANVEVVVLVAHGLPSDEVSALVRELSREQGLRVVVVAPGGEPGLLSVALMAGAMGYITEKSGLDRLGWVLDCVAAGRVAVDPSAVSNLVHELVKGASPRRPLIATAVLTAREQEVLRCLADGASTLSIAASLSMSPHTARTHIKSILGKLSAHTRLQATALAAEQHLI